MTSRLTSLAAGTVLDVDPAQAVDVAAAAGFGGVGLWFDPATWTAATTAAVSRRLEETSVVPLDLEPVILGRGADHGDALHGRLLPGDGALPLDAVLAARPGVPVSLELRSKSLVAAHPDPVERARVVLAATERLLTSPPDHLPSR
jgi:hypothetical protein